MQPSWRTNNNNDETSGDWGKICRPGVNGILSVMAALFFWGDAIGCADEQVTWLEALNDILYVIEHI